MEGQSGGETYISVSDQEYRNRGNNIDNISGLNRRHEKF